MGIFQAQDEFGVCGFSLGQEGYIEELVRSHDMPGTVKAATPIPKEWVKELPPAEIDYSENELREAQRITEELLWISQRTRIDIAFAVGLMSSWATRYRTHKPYTPSPHSRFVKGFGGGGGES